MPEHIQRRATRQRADFAGSEGRGVFPPGRRRERLVVPRHHGAFRSYPWRKSAPAKCVTNFTDLTEVFFTYVKVAFFTAAFLCFPLFLIQLWLFVAPGLYKNEKSALAPFLAATPVLFFIGGSLVYYVIFPAGFALLPAVRDHGRPGVPADRAGSQGERIPLLDDEADLRLRPVFPASRHS